MRHLLHTATACLTLAVALGGCASYGQGNAPAQTSAGMLVGANGMTLYTFDRDAAGSGKSACNGACAAIWPPLTAGDADAAHGDYSIVMRDDGKKQWAYKGKPLYFWSKDAKAGDATGDGFNSVWHTARP
ncbi:hypothetical protein PY257_15685 [Ramlibacter sp. H39-3-26]|uniref:COG4315 family predicted lipoprotein n=1 Tax=Curvibacter soli TaxID=3031331 RepID=UPI0023DC6A56|nr:hypothetical protein [Ramlibacter sp. H39-3-26]MDF1486600.1 hypothetical protein [Ramlibacter sp. H39-3-26]